MKICIMSDTHLSAQLYTKMDQETGLNRFLVRQFESLEWVVNYLKKNNIDTIIHSGDVFDSPRVTAYPIKRTRELFSNFDVYAIKGNHDDSNFFHDNEMSALDLIDINAINKPCSKVIGGINFVFIPWGYDIDTSLKRDGMKNVLVAHGFPRDYFGDNSIVDKDNDTGGLISNKSLEFDMVITGHYHVIDEFKQGNTVFLNPGSMSEYSSGDFNGASIWILDTDNLTYERVEIPCAIRLVKSTPKDVNDYLSSIDKENIYRVSLFSKSIIDRKILYKARKIALDIQFKLIEDSKPEQEQVEKVDGFWDYVSKNSNYKEEFQTKLLTLGEE